MAPIRLAAGRAVDPLGRPKIVPARGVQIERPPHLSFPNREDVLLQPDAGIWALEPGPQTIAVEAMPIGILGPVTVAHLPSDLTVAGDPVQVLEPFADSGMIGGRIVPWMQAPPSGPPPLARSYRPRLQGGGVAVGDSPQPLQWLHRYLEPTPPLDPASLIPTLPRSLRPYQVEAVQALLDHPGFLLADDPGLGKTVAVCAALQVLFQSGQAHRALVVFLEGGSRHWVEHLITWAPGLLLTFVHGVDQQRAQDWKTPAHVYLTDYRTLAADLESGALPADALGFDVIVLVDALAFRHRADQRPPALDRLRAGRRWALSGALPQQADDWLSVFSFLAPDLARGGADVTLPDLTRRFRANTLRRTKDRLAGQLPRLTRQEIWVDLGVQQGQAYRAALAEERHRLIELGGSVTQSHIEAAIDRLKQVCSFLPGSLDGAKVRPLVNLVEEVVSAGSKLVVFSPYRQEGLDRLHRVLEAYGTVHLDASADETERAQAMRTFREDPRRHVLLTDLEIRPDGGPLPEATYIVHFDHGWNAAVRRRAEARLHPDPGPAVAVNVCEYWVAGTIEERLHALLKGRGLMPDDLAPGTRPAHLEDKLAPADWLDGILEIQSVAVRAPAPAPIHATTRQLPPLDLQREQLLGMTAEKLLANAARLMLAFGFPQSEPLSSPVEGGGDLVAARPAWPQDERVLVRCLRSEKDIGIGEARELLAALGEHPDFLGAYLVATTDFTPACKKLAEESRGRLTLVSGVELYRHLHILGGL